MQQAGDDDIPRLGAPLDEALAWFARLRNGSVSTDERRAFQSWLAAGPANAEAYARVQKLWQSPAFAEALGRFPLALPVPGRRRHRVPSWAAAASLVLLVGWSLAASGWLDRWRADYATVAGERRTVALADGSTVTLNTDSALTLAFEPGQRGVRLLSGEAYFEVKPDSARPFVVSTGDATVRVVGTRFTVRAGAEVSVAVDSGIVACANGRGEGVAVRAGQQVTISEEGVTMPEAVDAARAFSWLKGRLIFTDRPLGEVLQELDRYQPGAILLANRQLAETRVTGNYKLDDPAAIVVALAGISGARVATLSPYLTVIR